MRSPTRNHAPATREEVMQFLMAVRKSGGLYFREGEILRPYGRRELLIDFDMGGMGHTLSTRKVWRAMWDHAHPAGEGRALDGVVCEVEVDGELTTLLRIPRHNGPLTVQERAEVALGVLLDQGLDLSAIGGAA